MARIPYPSADDLDPESAALLAKMPPLNIFRMLAGSPGLLRAFTRLGNHILLTSPLDPLLRELAIVRVGLLSGAAYEVHQHDRIARSVGASDELIAALREGPDAAAFDDAQRAVLRFTDDVVANVRAGDDTLAAAIAVVGEAGVQELVVTIGYYMLVSRYLETIGIDIEEDPVEVATRKAER